MKSRQNSYQPLNKQFINWLEKGIQLLDETSHNEMLGFIKTQQHKKGAFTNRGGRPDCYYSLFGLWLIKAFKMAPEQKKMKRFIFTYSAEKTVDKFATLLIRNELEELPNKPSVFTLLKWVLKDGKRLNVAYRFFLFLLTFDALYERKKWMTFGVKTALYFYRVNENLPCSFHAAIIIAKVLSKADVSENLNLLQSYFEKGKGFKVFRETENADLLSTAVALFALKMAGNDVRIFSPDCLNLIQQNYRNGAFLSGDGDTSRDLEYTFYGLLALGALA